MVGRAAHARIRRGSAAAVREPRVVLRDGGCRGNLRPEQLRRFLRFMRRDVPIRRARAALSPLLRATDSFLAYRKGPFALYALSEYIGEERVTLRSGACSRSTVGRRRPCRRRSISTGSFRRSRRTRSNTCSHDLFEANTFWELKTERATAEQTEAGTWQVTLDVRARKVVVDEAGVETEVPMNDWVEIGVFARRRGEAKRAALPADASHPLRQADDHGDGAAQARARRHRPALLTE